MKGHTNNDKCCTIVNCYSSILPQVKQQESLMKKMLKALLNSNEELEKYKYLDGAKDLLGCMQIMENEETIQKAKQFMEDK